MKNLIFLVILLLLTTACRTTQDISLFQGLENLTQEQIEAMNQKYVPRICIDDALIINVTSPDRTTTAQFAVPPYGYFIPGESETGLSATTQNLFTFLVDENGEINFPVLGRIHLAGLSINEAIRKMESLIWETAPNAVVLVQIANFRVSIIGEVKLPDSYPIKTSRLSVLDLIAMAGDLTIYADRKNVWLHRDNNGEKIHIKMDLTDPMIFASPYYYLQQNDIIYVLPNEAQKRTAKYSRKDDTTTAVISSILSSLTLLATVIAAFWGPSRSN